MADADFYLPDDLWERICTFLNDEDGKDNNCYLKYVSLVSKKFPAITNSIRFSLTIRKETRPFLTPIFHRFPNLTSLDLSRFRGNYRVDRNTFLTEISCYPLNITLLNFANSALIPLNGLRLLISDCFSLLEELHLSKPAIFHGDFLNGMDTLSLAIPKLRKVNLSRHTYLNDQLLFQLFNNWKLLEEVIIFDCTGITDVGIASALRVRPTLRSLSFHKFFKSDNISTLFVLIKSCTSLMKLCKLRHLNLAHCSKVKLCGVNFEVPKLEVLNLSYTGVDNEELYLISKSCRRLLQLLLEHCYYVTKRGVNHVVENCTQLREINLKNCYKVTLSPTFHKGTMASN
ncbi:F-box/RNI superfamily protein, putative [Medicago truncatula]|uniref:F-box/RNI superfamily protein, putative n=1 Tax=Medicago truncatula TaxID=3880 RepID=G7LCW4_MEDTR|nr:F-box/RNI superfamily protein, putative [Medicago truncatula]